LVGTVFNVFLGLAGGFLAGLSFLTAMRFPPMIKNFMNIKPVGVQHLLLGKTQRTKTCQRIQRVEFLNMIGWKYFKRSYI
ncbi:MAG: hypothetical protein ACX933_18255, partial [Marinobacter adhaerens]